MISIVAFDGSHRNDCSLMGVVVFVHSCKTIHTVHRAVNVGDVFLTFVVNESDNLAVGWKHFSVVGTEADESALYLYL